MTTANKKAQGRAGTCITVDDARTERSAVSNAQITIRGEKQGDYIGREVTATVLVQYGVNGDWGVTPDTGVLVKCVARTFRSGAFVTGDDQSTARKFTIQDAELGDLPLIVLALQDAIRIGAEQGSFCELSPNANQVADTIKRGLVE